MNIDNCSLMDEKIINYRVVEIIPVVKWIWIWFVYFYVTGSDCQRKDLPCFGLGKKLLNSVWISSEVLKDGEALKDKCPFRNVVWKKLHIYTVL